MAAAAGLTALRVVFIALQNLRASIITPSTVSTLRRRNSDILGKEAGKFQSLSILNPVSFPPCRAVSPCVKTCLITFNPSTSGVWLLDQGRLAEPEALGGLRRGPGAGSSSRPGCRNTKTSRFACLLFVLAEK